jgi:hypothetical protein
VNDSWVLLVAMDEGEVPLVGPEFWVRCDGRKVHPDAPEHYAGFTDEPSTARRKPSTITLPEEPAP